MHRGNHIDIHRNMLVFYKRRRVHTGRSQLSHWQYGYKSHTLGTVGFAYAPPGWLEEYQGSDRIAIVKGVMEYFPHKEGSHLSLETYEVFSSLSRVPVIEQRGDCLLVESYNKIIRRSPNS
jgi:hypothetical protein